MQRRAATIYFVFFLVMAASAYSVIAVADQPAVEIEGDTYENGSQFTLDGQEYTVTKAALETAEGGDHGGGGASYAATIAWTNESYQYSAALANNSTVAYQDGTYRLLVEDGSAPSTFTLRQEFNVSQRLAEDPDVENRTYTSDDGTEFVRYRNGSTQPLDQYLPEPETVAFSEGDEFAYDGNRTTVSNVSSSEVAVVWTGDRKESVSFGQAENITLASTEYFAHFSGHDDGVTITLAPAEDVYPSYQRQAARQDYFQERMNGLWGIVILAGSVATLIVGLAMLPKKG